MKNKSSLGFSMIELLLVISIITIVGASSIAVGSGFLVRNNLKNKTNELVSAVRTAQINSISGKEASSWGVKVTASKIIMFKGASYTIGTPFDQSYDIPASITVTPVEIFFNRLSGNPNSTSNVTISSNAGDTRTITVNEVGTVKVN